MKLSIAFVLAGLASYVSAADFKLVTRASSNIDATIFQYALTLEHLEANFYAGGLKKFSAADFKKAGYGDEVRERVAELGSQEAMHVQALSSILGKSATQACSYNFDTAYKSVDNFLATASVLENVGVSAYSGAAQFVTSKQYLTAAASILAVEAEHVGELGALQGQDGAPSSFVTPLSSFSDVYSLAAPFIKSCPKSNPSLPVTQFPSLTIKQSTPRAGHRVDIDFKWKKGQTYYAHLLSGIADLHVPVTNDSQVNLPKDLHGFVYMVISTSKTLSDKNTVAGPAILQLPYSA